MDRISRTIIVVALAILAISCQNLSDPEITSEELGSHISYLASEELEGRFPGTPGDSLAADYIKQQFKNNGLELLGDNGFQTIRVNTQVELGDSNTIFWHRRNFQPEKDFVPVSFSGNGSVNSDLAFVGYGIQVNNSTLKHDDYKGVTLKDRTALILLGAPPVEEGEADPYDDFASQRYKALTAIDQGANAVVFIAGEAYDDGEEMGFKNRKEPTLSVPVIRLKRAALDRMLESSGYTTKELEQMSNQPDFQGFEMQKLFSLQTDLRVMEARTQNVAGLLKGPNYPDDSIIVIGAHYDHLGWGGKSSGSRVPDTTAIHYGADDNASGVSAVIELAGKLNAAQADLKHSYVFIAFAAEELGLIGSKFFVENPLVQMDQVKAMINLDMLGRLNEENKLNIGGVGTALEFKDLLKEYNSQDFLLGLSQEGYGPSDHASFYGKNKPVLFISTGAHVDYHTPADSYDKINLAGMEAVVWQIYEWTRAVDALEQLNYREAGPKQQTSERHRYKVTLGIMPDVSGQSTDGLKIEFVTEGRPAHRAGLQKGDVIVAMEGLKVGNIYDYMARLQALEAGQTITVEVMRAEEKMVFLVQL